MFNIRIDTNTFSTFEICQVGQYRLQAKTFLQLQILRITFIV